MTLRQISVFLENKKGRLAEVVGLIAREKINIRALALADTADFGVLRLIVNDTERCFVALKQAGFVAQKTEVLAVEVNDRPAGSQASVEAVDFGVNVAGKPFRLLVADITTDQLLQLRQDTYGTSSSNDLASARSISVIRTADNRPPH